MDTTSWLAITEDTSAFLNAMNKFQLITLNRGTMIAQSVWRLATGWTTEGSEFDSR
jgi:hypothetical protein